MPIGLIGILIGSCIWPTILQLIWSLKRGRFAEESAFQISFFQLLRLSQRPGLLSKKSGRDISCIDHTRRLSPEIFGVPGVSGSTLNAVGFRASVAWLRISEPRSGEAPLPGHSGILLSEFLGLSPQH